MNQIAHSRTPFNTFNRNRAIIFSVFALALAVLSFQEPSTIWRSPRLTN